MDEVKQRVREQFGAAGDAYVRSATHREGEDLRRLVEWSETTQVSRALDIATGGGHTALAIGRRAGKVVLADLTLEMLRHARAFVTGQGLSEATFAAADAEELPFTDASFDVVTCRIAPHHFADVRRAVQEVARVLVPGGVFLLIDSLAPEAPELDEFINTLDRRRDPSHVRSYTLSEWTDFLFEAGLTVERTETFRKRHDFADWTARSRMVDEERAALADWVLAAPDACKSYFMVEAENGRLIAFSDEKVLIKSRKRG